MNGIHIISKEEIKDPWIGICVTSVISYIWEIVWIIIAINQFFKTNEANYSYIGMMFVGLLIFMLGDVLSILFFETPTGRYKYKVVFDDTVTVNEVLKNYNNISVDKDGVYSFEDKTKLLTNCK